MVEATFNSSKFAILSHGHPEVRPCHPEVRPCHPEVRRGIWFAYRST
ncbi:MAG: hypothetical protein IH831_06895 [Planctomycetes bacterium]|nr:hypothetical protein [Planctomycetota bacterium]